MSNSAGNCFIAVLPDEILLEIFSYIQPEWHSRKVPSPFLDFDAEDHLLASDWDDWDEALSSEDTGDEVEAGGEEETGGEAESEMGGDTGEVHAEALWVPLAIVCRKWRLIYDAILYRQLNVKTEWGKNPSLRILPLLDLLERRPVIQNCPRIIRLSLMTMGRRNWARIGRILRLCKSIRKVELHTRWSPDIWPLLHEIEKMPRLEELSLSGIDHGPSISLIFNNFDLPTLRTLNLWRYGPGVEGSPFAPWSTQQISVSRSDLEAIFPSSKYHTSKISSLQLSDPSALPMVTEHILRMPANLVNLSLTDLTCSYAASDYTVVAIQRILDIHRYSLKSIELGIIPGDVMKSSMPDFARFPILEKLTMSSYNSIDAETTDNALRKLSGPCLRTLLIKFNTTESRQANVEPPSGFNKTHAKWIKDFAALKQSTASALEFIHIKVNPIVTVQTGLQWPWENVEQAWQEVAQFGLTICYEPRYSKDEWSKLLEKRATKRSRSIMRDPA